MTQEALKQWADDISKAYDILAWGHSERAAEILKNTKVSIYKALAQTQEPVPPPWWPAVENILTEYGLQAIDFVADFKQALAQEQEPVATLAVREHAPVGKVAYVLEVNLPVGIHKLYTLPPQRTQVDLTDEEVFGLFGKFTAMTGKSWLDLYRMTEAKRKEKNT